MAAVAILAVVFGGFREVPRLLILRGQYLGLAEKYGYWETRLNGVIAIRQDLTHYSVHQPRGPEPSPARLAKMKAMAGHYARQRAKYEQAARQPWRPVEPDPPEP